MISAPPESEPRRSTNSSPNRRIAPHDPPRQSRPSWLTAHDENRRVQPKPYVNYKHELPNSTDVNRNRTRSSNRSTDPARPTDHPRSNLQLLRQPGRPPSGRGC